MIAQREGEKPAVAGAQARNEVAGADRKQLNVRVERDLHVRLKVVAAIKGRSMAELVEDFVRARLIEEERGLGIVREGGGTRS